MISPKPQPKAGTGMNPLALLLRLFSSVRFGIVLLLLLFIYSSIGSAGLLYPIHPNIFSSAAWKYVELRKLSAFELTEFEWFNWWPFKLLIALICVTLVVTTLRRIKFKPVNFGVWMIHTGIIILCIGSVIYFSQKVEGDAPVVRRQVHIELPTGESATLSAIPGNQTLIGSGDHVFTARITSIDPQWELLSGDDKGAHAYAVNVMMQSQAGGTQFIRQLLVGYPQYTEDMVRSGDPQQPFSRAIKVLGRPLVDDAIKMTLEYEPQRYFYLSDAITKAFALYVRPLGSSEWTERPIQGMPMFQDYVGSTSEVWLDPNDSIPLRALDVTVPATKPNDPLPHTPLRISGYLPYASMEQRMLPGGDTLNPVAAVRVRSGEGLEKSYTLVAFDTNSNSAENGLLQFRWIESADDLVAMAEVIQPALVWTDPASGAQRKLVIDELSSRNPDAKFKSIEGTAYSYRVANMQDNLQLTPDAPIVSMATIEVRTPEHSFRRWVFTDPSMNRDMKTASTDPHAMAGHEETLPLDEGLDLAYQPGKLPPPVTLIAGPRETDFGMLLAVDGQQPRYQALVPGQIADLTKGVTMEVLNYAARTRAETRPFVVPKQRRNKDNGLNYAMVKVEIPGAGGTNSYWVPYHHWPFRNANEALRRFPYRPVVVVGPDNKKYEVILSRQRLLLPSPVVLDDFKLATQIGGFTGSTLSVRDWTSVIKFDDDGAWSGPESVSINAPIEHAGLWYFQAQWDPPMGPRFQGDASSAGLNYTVLGIGSRHGVNVQLAGCCIAVLGMIYAFYWKPVLRRRERDRAIAAAKQRAANSNGEASAAARRPQQLVSVSASSHTQESQS